MTDDALPPPAEVVGWVDDQDYPEFGSVMRFGSCHALLRENDGVTRLCGWPRNEDGSCLQGHRREETRP